MTGPTASALSLAGAAVAAPVGIAPVSLALRPLLDAWLVQAHVVDRANVMAGIRNSGNDPEKFATQLLQAQQVAVSPECIDLSGYEHCTQCAKPALTKLVTELVKVRRRPRRACHLTPHHPPAA